MGETIATFYHYHRPGDGFAAYQLDVKMVIIINMSFSCEYMFIQGDATPIYKWIIIPSTIRISTVNHTYLLDLQTNLAKEQGHHLVLLYYTYPY